MTMFVGFVYGAAPRSPGKSAVGFPRLPEPDSVVRPMDQSPNLTEMSVPRVCETALAKPKHSAVVAATATTARRRREGPDIRASSKPTPANEFDAPRLRNKGVASAHAASAASVFMTLVVVRRRERDTSQETREPHACGAVRAYRCDRPGGWCCTTTYVVWPIDTRRKCDKNVNPKRKKKKRKSSRRVPARPDSRSCGRPLEYIACHERQAPCFPGTP